MLLSHDERNRWWTVGAAAVAVVVVGFVAVQRWWPHDSATQVEVDEVLDRYRDEMAGSAGGQGAPSVPASAPTSVPATTVPAATATTATPAATQPVATAPPTTAAPAPTLPAPGVYVYATEGREHVTALGGTEHVYPPQTLLTVTPAGCGVHLRWDLLVERYEEWNLCVVDGAIVLQPDGVQFHEFYGQQQTDVAECGEVVPIVPAPPPGTSIDRACTLAGEAWNPVWTAGTVGVVTIDGTTVATTTFEVTIELDGDYPEHSTQRWTFAHNGLPVAIEFDMESSNPSPIGDVTYTETITATLARLEPLS